MKSLRRHGRYGGGCMENSRAQRLRHLMNCEGWSDLMAMLDEQISEPKDALYEVMTRQPHLLDKPTSIAKANRARALEDFKESLLEANQAK